MYRVLARKYRPQTFDDLIGQEVLVRTLTNAFASGRIAHAFMLTGIRGIGKTTTARIIARGLNCIGADGNGEATTEPCGVCSNCIAIAEDRHVDVIEMDAASNTGVENMRDVIESVQYAPTSARYKVYIIDEVHMLSKSAFNALLKTLEEPPPHVKFIFATTEIRKIPVTIISRCQRFDLKRVDGDMLANHLVDVAKRENIVLDELCSQLIATAAEGSVRDSLSILDQAIAMHTDTNGNTDIKSDTLRDMLGLADKSQVFTLLEQITTGKVEEALTQANLLHNQGADPQILLNDLMEIVHYITRVAAAPQLASDVHYSPREQENAKRLTQALSIPALTRAWQILLKGAEEMRQTSQALPCLEMILVRLGYASQLPTPAALIKQLQNPAAIASAAVIQHEAPQPPRPTSSYSAPVSHGATALATHAVATPQPQPQPMAKVETFEDVLELFKLKREPMLLSHLISDLRLVSFAKGKIEMKPVTHIAADIPARINRRLHEWTGERWTLVFSDAEGQPTIAEQCKMELAKARQYAESHPKIRAVMEHFPTAKIVDFIPNKKSE
jgi:DNA polymerase-3 subunit gamma/tau